MQYRETGGSGPGDGGTGMLTGKSLTGQVAIVTGASRGIGKAVAQALAAEGATVIINYNGSAEAAEAVAADIRSQGGMAEAVKCNVADFAESEAFVKAVTEKYGRVDILVNNAGITRDNLIVRMTEEEFNAVLDTNLKGAFHMIRHLTKTFMKQRYGKIINISSVSGIVGNAGQANYSASKAGLIGLTKSVARELASRNICVNAVAPGFIRTDMTDKLPEAVQDNVGQIPLKKMGRPEDVAQAVLFLAGDASDYITGQVLCVDGGMAM